MDTIKPYRNSAQFQQMRKLAPQQSVQSSDAQTRLNQRNSSWDEGTIEKFTNDPSTKAFTYLLPTAKSTLHLWTQDTKKVTSIAETVERILLWMDVPQGFIVNLWLQDDPRVVKADEWPSRRTVNGGWTIPNTNEVFVYREEEWERVLLHELIHALGMDWKMDSTPLPCWNVQGNLAPHLFEAWTELYAEWLYCAWFNILWETQRKHQDKQALQILARNRGAKWDENTNVFAYYILKAALAPHIEFLLPFQMGHTKQESIFVLCELVSSRLVKLKHESKKLQPEAISLRMTAL